MDGGNFSIKLIFVTIPPKQTHYLNVHISCGSLAILCCNNEISKNLYLSIRKMCPTFLVVALIRLVKAPTVFWLNFKFVMLFSIFEKILNFHRMSFLGISTLFHFALQCIFSLVNIYNVYFCIFVCIDLIQWLLTV